MSPTLGLAATGGAVESGQAQITPAAYWPQGPGWQHLLTRPMMIAHIGGGAADAYGNESQTITSIDYVNGYIEPIVEVLHLVEANTYATTHQVVLPPQIELTAEDRITVWEPETVLAAPAPPLSQTWWDWLGGQTGTVYRVTEALAVTNARTGAAHHIEGHVLEQTG